MSRPMILALAGLVLLGAVTAAPPGQRLARPAFDSGYVPIPLGGAPVVTTLPASVDMSVALVELDFLNVDGSVQSYYNGVTTFPAQAGWSVSGNQMFIGAVSGNFAEPGQQVRVRIWHTR